jgi:ubiquinone/menaquinone biosynthesis C-methylase UbiE
VVSNAAYEEEFKMNQACKEWYEESYQHEGFNAQRNYPNEELCRYMGRNFFKVPKNERRQYKILEVGCGSCANLWMIASEGFDAYGCDLSEHSIKLGREMLSKWGVNAQISAQDMTKMNYPDNTFNSVVDVFSSYCLDESGYQQFLKEVRRVLRQDGIFYSYTPSKTSGAFLDHKPSRLIDKSTLDGIRRENSPFSGNYYPFRFMDASDTQEILKSHGFLMKSIEIIGKSYNNMTEKFEWLSFEAIKK